MKAISSVWIILVSLFFGVAKTHSQSYQVFDLGTLGGSTSQAYGINTNGQIVGQSYNSYGVWHAFLYSNGSMQDLGTLSSNSNSTSYAYGINDLGQVVGCGQTNGSSRAFLYSSGVMSDIGSGQANGINDAGQVIGVSGNGHSFLYSNTVMIDLNIAYGINNARGISTNGQIVGETVMSGASYPCLYSNGVIKSLYSLRGGNYGVATGVNAKGQVAGWANTTSGANHAFLYSNGSMQDLGTLGGNYSSAYGINIHGQVVGQSYTAGNNYQDAFLYSNGMMRDLNNLIDPTAGWSLQWASAISDLGQIVGWGINASGQQHAFLLNPLPPPPLPVLTIAMAPMISINGGFGCTYNLQYVDALSPTNLWTTLATITITNVSQSYFDSSAVCQPQRLYRLVQVP